MNRKKFEKELYKLLVRYLLACHVYGREEDIEYGVEHVAADLALQVDRIFLDKS